MARGQGGESDKGQQVSRTKAGQGRAASQPNQGRGASPTTQASEGKGASPTAQPTEGQGAKSGVCGFLVARAGQCSERGGGNIKAEHRGDRQQAAAAAHKGERSARVKGCNLEPSTEGIGSRQRRRRTKESGTHGGGPGWA